MFNLPSLLETIASANKNPTKYRLGWESFPFSRLGQTLNAISSARDDEPIFFLGTQSGGLTLMSRMLKRHSQTVYCSGNRAFWAGRDEMQNLASDYLPEALRITPRGDLSNTTDGAVLHALSNSLYASNATVELYRIRESGVSPDDISQLRGLVTRYTRTYGFAKKAPRFVDKSQSFILRIPLLRAAFPRARFIS